MAAPDRREDGAPRRLMTPVAAAEYLGGIAKQTLAKWRCLGGGPEFVRVGSRILYEHRALDAWLDARRRTSTSEVTSPPRGNRSPASGGAPVGTTGNHTTDSTSARAPSAGVGERFDVAIVGNEGQSVEAELELADHLQLPVFVLHDFDRTGLTICQNLRAGTWRYQYQNEFDVVEVGLRLDQVQGLESEPITKENLKSVGNDRLRECGATEQEVQFLRDRRVELNALITEQLVELVEDALTEHGIRKVIPDDEGARCRLARRQGPRRDRRSGRAGEPTSGALARRRRSR